jgi:cytoskeletal protein CcmA (bactofilin family)
MKTEEKTDVGDILSSNKKAVSLIGKELTFVGTLIFGDGVVRLDGRLEGKISGKATRATHITPAGKLFGKIQTAKLVIERGGTFDGEGKAGNLAT